MLFAAAGCVGFAVFMMIDIQTSAQASVSTDDLPVLAVAQPSASAPVVDAVVEPVSWIQIIPPDEDLMYEQYVHIPDEYENIIAPAQPILLALDAPPIPAEYSALPFYINENSTLYAAFWQERPDLDIETIVWMVNASIHVPFYSQISVNYQTNPLFITPAYRLPDGFFPVGLVPVNNDECHLRATPEAVAAFKSLRTAAREAGFDLAVTSAYRSASRQSTLWENGGQRDGRVARPYHSEHQTGRALDLWGPGGLLDSSGPTPTGQWVADNLHEYGFILRYRAETTHITGYIYEPWHITYVSTGISMYMHENNILSLEEFVGRNPGAALP